MAHAAHYEHAGLSGRIHPSFDTPELREALGQIGASVEGGTRVYESHAVITRATLNGLDVAIKSAGPVSALRSFGARHLGSSVRRTYEASCALHERGIDTPQPIAFLERWQGSRLLESFYIARFDERVVFKDALAELYARGAEWDAFVQLLAPMAKAVRALHDAGIRHGDLGNQNILIQRTRDGWSTPAFLDVGRAAVGPGLGGIARARDLSRLALPYALLQATLDAYEETGPVPGLRTWESLIRFRFALHTRSRSLRHPIRELVRRQKPSSEHHYPALRDMWIWDRTADQPRRLWRPIEQRLLRPQSAQIRSLIAAHPAPSGAPRAIRYRIWDSEAEHAQLHARCAELHAAGQAVGIALLQNRNAVQHPDAWRRFCSDVRAAVDVPLVFVEAGHGLEDPTWGVWTQAEAEMLVDTAKELWSDAPGSPAITTSMESSA